MNLTRDQGDDAVVPSDARKHGAPGLNGPSGSPTRRRVQIADPAVERLRLAGVPTTNGCYSTDDYELSAP